MAQNDASGKPSQTSVSFARLGMYAAVLLVGLAVVLYATATPAPDISNTQWYESRHFRISYPGNWEIDLSHPKYDADYDIYIDAPRNGWAHITIYDSKTSIDEELSTSLEEMRGVFTDHDEGESFTNWGGHVGIGQTIYGKIRGKPHVLRVFIKQLNPGYVLEIHELFEQHKTELFDPGFELLRSSFTLR